MGTRDDPFFSQASPFRSPQLDKVGPYDRYKRGEITPENKYWFAWGYNL